MKTTIHLILFLSLAWNTANAQVGIGTTTPKDDAALDVESTTRGFLPPRMTGAERDAITSPAQGLVIYNTDTDCVQWYDGSFWYDGCTGSEAPDPLPGNITLEQVATYFIASADDDDYLDNTGDLPNNTTEAQLPGGTEDDVDAATGDQLIDIQGTLTTTGVTINIPYEVSSGSVDLTSFSQTITIPAAYTENNTATNITFSYPSQTGLSGTGVIPATLNAQTNDLEVIKFDYNSGSGSDFLGFLLGKFTYVLDDAGNTGDLEVRGTPGVLDKNFGDGDHDLVYIPVVSTPTGKTWLNNNLGANYANINDTANFDPSQQATGLTDFNAYGSLNQWGRVADGHELVNWSNGTTGSQVNGNQNGPVSNAIPNTNNFITTSTNWYNGSNPSPDDLWQDNTKTIYDPCPNGFRVPTEGEWQAEITDGNWSNATDVYDSALKLSFAGLRGKNNDVFFSTGSRGDYFSSSVTSGRSFLLRFDNSSSNITDTERGDAMSIRCIQE